ncbi:MAG: hypothetical protein AAFY17_13730 [Cyanobacteria bacterium J06642_11]
MLTDEAKDGPRLFSFKLLDPGFFDRPKWVSAKFQLTLWCEHARKPLPVLNNGSQQGVYELELNREWFTKAVPYFKLLTGTLSLVLPVAASTTQFMLDDATYKGIQEDLDLGQKAWNLASKAATPPSTGKPSATLLNLNKAMPSVPKEPCCVNSMAS